MNILDLTPEANNTALFVGESGSGKSCALASYGKLGKVLFLDFDRRSRGIHGLRKVLGDDCLKNIDLRQFNIVNSFTEVDNLLKAQCDLSKQDKCEYKTIILESVNSLETCFMNMVDVLAQQKMAMGSGVIHSTVGGIRTYGPTHHKFAATAFRQLRDFRFLDFKNVNIILSCWTVNKWGKPKEMREVNGRQVEVEKQYADGIVVGRKLLLTDKMCEEVPGCFDEIYEFYKEEGAYSTSPTQHSVSFQSSLARTANERLKGIRKLDLTDKCFIDEYNRLLGK